MLVAESPHGAEVVRRVEPHAARALHDGLDDDGRGLLAIIDGCRLARAPTRIYPHCDATAVNAQLAGSEGRGMVVSDSVFSMDGDLAPIADLSEVCANHGALLILDDAHLVLDHPETLHPHCRVLRMGTLSKAVGTLGGYATGPLHLHGSARQHRPLLHLHHRGHPGRGRRGRSRHRRDRLQ